MKRICPKRALLIGMTHEFDHHKDNETLMEWSRRYKSQEPSFKLIFFIFYHFENPVALLKDQTRMRDYYFVVISFKFLKISYIEREGTDFSTSYFNLEKEYRFNLHMMG